MPVFDGLIARAPVFGVANGNIFPLGNYKFPSMGTKLRFVDAGFAGNSGVSYTTIQAAITAASSGETVVVMPGTYAEEIILKDGVNIYLMNGATVGYIGATTSKTIFKDNGVAVACRITGEGQVVYTTATNGLTGRLFYFTNASSSIYIELDYADLECTSGVAASSLFMLEGGGLVTLVVDKVKLRNNDGAPNTVYGCFTNIVAGKASIFINRILSSGAGTPTNLTLAFQMANISNGLSLKINSQEGTEILSFIEVNNVPAIFEIELNGDVYGEVNQNSNGSIRINGKKITSVRAGARAVTANAVSGAYLNISCDEIIQDAANTAGETLVLANAGNLIIERGIIRNLWNNPGAMCLKITGTGNLIIKSPVAFVGTHASTLCLTADSAKNAKLYGQVVSNRAKHANVTVQVGTLTVDANVV